MCRGKKKRAAKTVVNMPQTQLFNLLTKFNYDLDFLDEQERVAEYNWLRYLTAFSVDYARTSIISTYLTAKKQAQIQHPLKVVLWRMYLIWIFDADPFVTDTELQQKCKPYKTKVDVSPQQRTKKANEKTDYAMASKIRACELIQMISQPN